MDSIPYSDLRARLAETLKRLEAREEPVFISRRGQPAGVLMSVAQYRRLQGAPVGFGQALLAWRERHGTALAAVADDAWHDPFADVRDRSTDGGRPAVDFTALRSAPPRSTKPSNVAAPAPGPKRPRRAGGR